MATVRTFYWDPTDAAPVRRRRPWSRRPAPAWRVGNAGDLLNRTLIEHEYGSEVANVDDEDGRRLMLIGSVAHRVRSGDLVYGVGSKGVPVPGPGEAPCRVVGTRGPITTAAFASAGHDVGGLEFELDPGLLITRLVPDPDPPETGRVCVVPHYRDDLGAVPLPRGVEVVGIDAQPVDVARQICRAELVLASSLHGLVFAHALGRPAVLVRPDGGEALLKYEDYTLSLGLPWRVPPTLEEALRGPKPDSPVTLPDSVAELRLPAWDDLVRAGVAA